MIGRDLLPPLSSFFLDRIGSEERLDGVEVTFDDGRFGVREAAADIKKIPRSRSGFGECGYRSPE